MPPNLISASDGGRFAVRHFRLPDSRSTDGADALSIISLGIPQSTDSNPFSVSVVWVVSNLPAVRMFWVPVVWVFPNLWMVGVCSASVVGGGITNLPTVMLRSVSAVREGRTERSGARHYQETLSYGYIILRCKLFTM